MRLVFALLLCLVPAATFAAPIQLSLSGTVISKQSLLTVVDVGDPFSALLTYDLPPGATKTSVSGFLYYKGGYRNAASPFSTRRAAGGHSPFKNAVAAGKNASGRSTNGKWPLCSMTSNRPSARLAAHSRADAIGMGSLAPWMMSTGTLIAASRGRRSNAPRLPMIDRLMFEKLRNAAAGAAQRSPRMRAAASGLCR